MITQTKCLLTSFEEGALGLRSHEMTVTVVGAENGQDRIVRRKTKPVLTPDKVSQVSTLGEAFVEHATSLEGILPRYDKFTWQQMSDKQKLKAHLRDIVGHDNFSFELI